jgi:sugar lactone lactonase YvrE
LNTPSSVAVDNSGNVYVADTLNHRIRLISPSGFISTLAGNSNAGKADGQSASAQFDQPLGITYDSFANVLYVSDVGNHRIRKVTPAGVVTTVAGNVQGFADGTGTAASFNSMFGLAVRPIANGDIYVADQGNHRIRKIDATGAVTTLAGDGTSGSSDSGPGAIARFNSPRGLVFFNDALYIADTNNHRIRKITL